MIKIIPIEKNKNYIFDIVDVSSDGNGISRYDGYTVFIPNTAPGDRIEGLVVKVTPRYGYAKLINILSSSPSRCDSPCPYSIQCGGCNLMHINYPAQLEIKKNIVDNAIKRIGKLENFKTKEIIGMDVPLRYRNKMVFPCSKNKNGEIVFGFYRERSHDVIPLDDCLLGSDINFNILKVIKEYMTKNNITPYNEAEHTGKIRRVFIRKSYHTNEIMVVISANCDNLPQKDELCNDILSVSKNIKSIILNINKSKNNLVLSDKNVVLFGNATIQDYLCGLKYEISPNSFFQVNPVQTEKLYKKALEFADISKDDTVMDIYCGIGTISLAAAKSAKNVIGVEIVPEAIENAKKNAKDNKISNAKFYQADAKTIVPKLIKDGITPSIVILDPPRKGCDNDTLQAIVEAKPKKVVYVSCNPSTLARDIKFLCDNDYSLIDASAVDMFPNTTHVECVVRLSRNKLL